MGSFIFKWEHPAEEVYVTGTFDGWSKSEKLIKTGNTFEKDVTLPSAQEKIYYKFVVDGNWVTDHTAPQENDASGNLNNVLTTERIVKHTPANIGIMSGVAPTSTTAELAKDVPLEKAPVEQTGSSDLPGSFPETPAAADFSINPLPAFDGGLNPIKLAPGEKVPDPSTLTNNTITSQVREDPDLLAAAEAAKAEPEPTFSVAPLPAFVGGVNPIKLAPGEKVPDASTLTGNTIHSMISENKEVNGGASEHAPVLPPVVTPQAERELNGTGILNLPPISKNLIPESSLPMGIAGLGTFDATPTIQSAGPQSTTAQLAAAVPLESSKVPEVVKESQAEAGFAPEASAVPVEVQEKSAVEKELLSEVPVAPATSEGTGGEGTDESEKGVTAGEAAASYASGAASKLSASATSKLPESVQNSINAEATTTKETSEVAKESIAEAGQNPEAAGNEEAVLEKKAVEKELLSEIKPETSTGEPAPKITEPVADTSIPAPAPVEVTPTVEPTAVEPAPKVTSPETEKLNAPASAPVAGKAESREVSPGTVPGSHTQTESTVTTGVASATTDKTTPATTPAKATTAGPSTPSSSKAADSPASSAAADKKKKRTSIFGKLKAKFNSHKEDKA